MRHDKKDRVSLALAQRIAAELPKRPEWLELARANLERWSRLNQNSAGLLRCYDEWRAILAMPVEHVCDVLIEETDRGQRLRQNSPFAGALRPDDIREIKRKRHEARSA